MIFTPTACSRSTLQQERWSGTFKGVHHDIWDRDFPSPPAMVTVMHEGEPVDAVAQTSKQGYSLCSIA